MSQPGTEFELNGNTYRAGRLNAWDQLDVARKLTPVVGGLACVDIGEVIGGRVGDSLTPLFSAIADMKDRDFKLVLKVCLSVVQKRNGNQWFSIITPQGDLMDENMGGSELIMLCVEVVKANLSGFTAGLPLNLEKKLSENLVGLHRVTEEE